MEGTVACSAWGDQAKIANCAGFRLSMPTHFCSSAKLDGLIGAQRRPSETLQTRLA